MLFMPRKKAIELKKNIKKEAIEGFNKSVEEFHENNSEYKTE